METPEKAPIPLHSGTLKLSLGCASVPAGCGDDGEANPESRAWTQYARRAIADPRTSQIPGHKRSNGSQRFRLCSCRVPALPPHAWRACLNHEGDNNIPPGWVSIPPSREVRRSLGAALPSQFGGEPAQGGMRMSKPAACRPAAAVSMYSHWRAAVSSMYWPCFSFRGPHGSATHHEHADDCRTPARRGHPRSACRHDAL